MKRQKNGNKKLGIYYAKKSNREINRKNNKNMKDTINEICHLALTITDTEVKGKREIFKGQADYHSPLKMGATTKQHKLSKYNNSVLDKILELKELIESGSDIV